MNKDFFSEHYQFLLIVTLILVLAVVIFALNIPRAVQFGLLIVSGLFIVLLFHSRESDEPPVGGGASGKAIARPRSGFEP